MKGAAVATPSTSVPLADALDAAATAWLEFRGGSSLDAALDHAVAEAQRSGAAHPRLRAATQDITTTAVRQLALVQAVVDQLAHRAPDPEVDALLCVTLAQLFSARYPAHTLFDQAVQAAKSRASTHSAAGFINALLRNAQRAGPALIETLQRDESVRFNAPAWWIKRLRAAWPDDWQRILETARTPPPLTLRVNVRRSSCAQVLQRLQAAGIAADRAGEVAVRLRQALPVERIPGFAEGEVSVQDAAAQWAALWLEPAAGARVLDACAAPGGKTAHLAERYDVHIDAMEIDDTRAQRIHSNLQRLGLSERVKVLVADAAVHITGTTYDAILLDAPCTASGIVRRHPDIPWLRRPTDVALLARTQARLLDALWPRLNPTGRLLYVVCSVFPEEGERQIEAFLARHADAVSVPLPDQPQHRVALQLLPTAAGAMQAPDMPDLLKEGAAVPAEHDDHDGFCYALIEKRPPS